MPVDEKHPQYENREYEWRQLRDTNDGTTAIKRSGILYLPMPNAMLRKPKINIPEGIESDRGSKNTSPQNQLTTKAPWNHNNAAYSAYLQRARFPEITANCRRGLVGIATKKSSSINLPSSLQYLEGNATPDGLNLEDLYERIVSELLVTGRYELLVEPLQSNNTFTLITYNAESFVNWKQAFIDDMIRPFIAVFEEKISANEKDRFTHEASTIQNALFILDDEGLTEIQGKVYAKQNFKDGVESGPLIIPTHMGKPSKTIPLTVITPMGLSFNVVASPLLGVSDIAISIYQKDADMSQSEFLTCNPMLVTSGVDSDEVPDIIGSAVSWNFPNEQAKAYYVEPSSNCLAHMNERILALFNEAKIYGASLLSAEKKAAESAETERLRQASRGATLKEICNSAAEGINNAIKQIAEWQGLPVNDEKFFEANLDFSEVNLSPQAMDNLLKSWMNGAISYETYFTNLQEGGVIPKDKKADDEMAQIESERPALDLTNASPPIPNETGIAPITPLNQGS